jgi:RNA polymerase sigma-70 factor (ECF subfamily)
MEEPAQMDPNTLESGESHQLIFSLVDRLPEKQREIFHLREIEEMSYEEIANHLDISLDQVKVNLHRARKTIREKLINQGITP